MQVAGEQAERPGNEEGGNKFLQEMALNNSEDSVKAHEGAPLLHSLSQIPHLKSLSYLQLTE